MSAYTDAQNALQGGFNHQLQQADGMLTNGNFDGAVSQYQFAGQAAVQAGGTGPLIDAAGQAVGVDTTPQTQMAYQANAGLASVAADGTNTPADEAQAFAYQMQAAYLAAFAAVTAAQGGNPPPPSNLQQLAQAVLDAEATDPAFCTNVPQGGTKANTVVHDFKNGWNAAGKTPQLAHNGQYDAPCADAVASLTGTNASPCNAGPPPPPPPPGQVTCSDGSVHPAGYVCPAPIVPVSGMPMWLKVLLGVLLVGSILTIGTLLYRRSKKKKTGAAGASESPRRKKRKKKRKHHPKKR